MQNLADRLDSRLDGVPETQPLAAQGSPSSRTARPTTVAEHDPAPVLLIRDAAVDAGVEVSNPGKEGSVSPVDVINTGLVSLPTALSLLQL